MVALFQVSNSFILQGFTRSNAIETCTKLQLLYEVAVSTTMKN